MWKEFKEFAMRGNLVDVAVAFVMGAAFGKVITTFTTGIVSPLIGLLGGTDLTAWKYVLKAASTDAAGNEVAEVAIMYGTFLSAVIDFIIVAFVMFMIVKGINKMKKKEEAAPAAPPAPSAEEKLLAEIRDLLKK
ncbi:MAG TPA: large-conductance mechanosensitive channel protein MscL [Flavilitoribacter sp.]|nr:large-conductance mechanosensitive channel protein MscL [Lewinella sp.]HMQ62671.1 large-conductance mechanosensitive channel protein MscL [Flavilitoribacter sp.]HMQ89714.1 large-conductance mechanosensitive channel protein MscL [Flavilitoribacter sp.]